MSAWVQTSSWPFRGIYVHNAAPKLDKASTALRLPLHLQACNLQSNAVLRVYNTLLTMRGGEEGSEQAHLPVVRLRLLRSQLTVLAPVVDVMMEQQLGTSFGSLYGGARREVSAWQAFLCPSSRDHGDQNWDLQLHWAAKCCGSCSILFFHSP